MLVKCLLLLFVPLLCLGTDQPSIWLISPPKAKTAGESVQLECLLNNTSEYPVTWLKKGDNPEEFILISRGPSLLTPDNRYRVTYTPSSDIRRVHINKLEIRNLNESDSGMYQCLVQLSIKNKITADVALTVRSPST